MNNFKKRMTFFSIGIPFLIYLIFFTKSIHHIPLVIFLIVITGIIGMELSSMFYYIFNYLNRQRYFITDDNLGILNLKSNQAKLEFDGNEYDILILDLSYDSFRIIVQNPEEYLIDEVCRIKVLKKNGEELKFLAQATSIRDAKPDINYIFRVLEDDFSNFRSIFSIKKNSIRETFRKYVIPFLLTISLPFSYFIISFFHNYLYLFMLPLILLTIVISILIFGNRSMILIAPSLFTSFSLLTYPSIFSMFIIAIVEMPNMEVYALLFAFLVVLNDTMAYVGGKLLGKYFPYHPVRISPKKTLVGFICGWATDFLIAYLFCYLSLKGLIPVEISILKATLLGIFMGFFTIIGDLIGSGIKRSIGVKDSGIEGFDLLGRGGFLDSFDSLIFSAPFFYFIINM